MKLKDKIISLHSAFTKMSVVTPDINNVRLGALEDFKKLGFPTNKLEAWKYTSLESVLDFDYKMPSNTVQDISYDLVKEYLIDDIATHKLVFVDGVFNEELSSFDTEQVDIALMSVAFNDARYSSVVDTYFNKIAKQDNLTALNTAFAYEGVFVHVAKSVTVEKPIQMVYLATGNPDALLLQPRNLIVIEQNAHVKVIERHQSLSTTRVLTNVVTEVHCAKDGTIDHYKIQNDDVNASIVDNMYLNHKSNTICSVHTFSFGGNITRNNLNFYQNGEHVDSILKGITLGQNEQHVDHNTMVHHIEPNCESHQDYKGIYNDKSVGVFNGKVYVEKDAQKTDAYQQNNNILLTNEATINAKPQLEIFADDVRCSHGCTIGQLDQSALFYMQQRGIPEKQANGLLMFAFANEVLGSVKIPALQKRITKTIAEKLDVKIDLDF